MKIKRQNDTMIMSDSLVCKNYGDMSSHFTSTFEKTGENEYKCNDCGTVMVVEEMSIVYDDKGRVNMQVVTKPKS